MTKNSSLYNKVYHNRKRMALIEKLGGKCEVCGIKEDLVIHRIYSAYNSSFLGYHAQVSFDGNIGTVNKFTPVSQAILKERAKILHVNRDNMVLLCFNCRTELIKEYGRKRKIGRKEIATFKDLK